jgi:hypothetical protein
MRQITEKITRAFNRRQSFKIGNSSTDGTNLFLFGNKIARWRHDGLWITNAGWKSNTTKERLNALSGVNISQIRGVWYLNGVEWNGTWINIDRMSMYTEAEEVEYGINGGDDIDLTSEWLDGEGYSKPINAVYHTNTESDLAEVESKLRDAGIKFRGTESDTVGMYKPNYFVVVNEADKVRALNILNS